MFAIESVSTVRCKDVDYTNETKTNSFEIELNMTDHKRNVLGDVEKSLEYQCR
jgi:hypothetical protein